MPACTAAAALLTQCLRCCDRPCNTVPALEHLGVKLYYPHAHLNVVLPASGALPSSLTSLVRANRSWSDGGIAGVPWVPNDLRQTTDALVCAILAV